MTHNITGIPGNLSDKNENHRNRLPTCCHYNFIERRCDQEVNTCGTTGHLCHWFSDRCHLRHTALLSQLQTGKKSRTPNHIVGRIGSPCGATTKVSGSGSDRGGTHSGGRSNKSTGAALSACGGPALCCQSVGSKWLPAAPSTARDVAGRGLAEVLQPARAQLPRHISSVTHNTQADVSQRKSLLGHPFSSNSPCQRQRPSLANDWRRQCNGRAGADHWFCLLSDKTGAGELIHTQGGT